MKLGFLYIIVVFLIIIFSCNKEYSNIPALEFVNISKLTLNQEQKDSVYITIKFADGDGDLVSDFKNLKIYDSRDNSIIDSIKIQNPGLFTDGEYQSGELTFMLKSSCCIYNDSMKCGTHPTILEDEMIYKINAIDKSGNESNTIESPRILLNCNL